MKKLIKKILVSLGIFYKVKFSSVFKLYQNIAHPEIKKQFDEERVFFASLLGKNNKLIFDIGANQGNKTKLFAELSERVIAIDPDETNNKILNIRFAHNPGITILKKAVDNTVGEAELFIVEEGSGLNTMSSKWKETLENTEKSRWDVALNFNKKVTIETITLDNLLNEFGVPDYIKIDVEGFEKNVIGGLKRKVPLLSFECNLPEFYEETLWCINHLNGLSPSAAFNYYDEYNWGFGKFVGYEEFLNWYKSNQRRYFEIFCKL